MEKFAYYRIMFISLASLFTLHFTTAQIQIGNDIYGEERYDRSGQTVSISNDGSRVAIGATHNDDNGNQSGQVRVYEYQKGEWVQIGQDLDGDGALDHFGHSVSISASGNHLAIGTLRESSNNQNKEYARIFEFNGEDWIQMGSDILSEELEDFTGAQVLISAKGTRVAVSSPNYEDTPSGNIGKIRVFEYNGEDWIQMGPGIFSELPDFNLSFMSSFSDDGLRVVYRTIDIVPPSTIQTHNLVYEYDGTNWNQLGDSFIAENYTSGSMSGDGKRIAIGEGNYNSNSINNSGRIRVFEFKNGNWEKIGNDISGSAINETMGRRISLSKNGSRLISSVKSDNTSVHTFKIFDFLNGDWIESEKKIISPRDGNHSESIALSGDGNRFAHGAPRLYFFEGIPTSLFEHGFVRIFGDLSTIIVPPNELHFYPNPTDRFIRIASSTISFKNQTILITDSMGRLVQTYESYDQQIDISNLPAGVYFMSIISSDEVYSGKVIKH